MADSNDARPDTTDHDDDRRETYAIDPRALLITPQHHDAVDEVVRQLDAEQVRLAGLVAELQAPYTALLRPLFEEIRADLGPEVLALTDPVDEAVDRIVATLAQLNVAGTDRYQVAPVDPAAATEPPASQAETTTAPPRGDGDRLATLAARVDGLAWETARALDALQRQTGAVEGQARDAAMALRVLGAMAGMVGR